MKTLVIILKGILSILLIPVGLLCGLGAMFTVAFFICAAPFKSKADREKLNTKLDMAVDIMQDDDPIDEIEEEHINDLFKQDGEGK